jgi:glycosyltransferase involved in cell wall biosynthesis
MEENYNKYNIICLSNQIWDFPLWTNKKHVMSRLPKLGHNVLFVDPPINTGRLFLRHLLQGKWSLKRLFTKVKKTEEGVTVFSPLNSHPISQKYSVKHAEKINKIADRIFKDKEKKTVLWIYHVEIKGLENYLKHVKHDFLVYDCVDNYEGFPKYNTPEKKKWIQDQEEMLATRANIVFSTTPGLMERLKKYNPKTYFTPNVGDYERFFDIKNKGFEVPEDIKDIKKPIVAFTGAVDEYKFDKELFQKIAEENPEYSFVIIGPMALKDRGSSKKELGFENLNNVYFLGTKDYKDLPKYLAHFDEMIIPYQLNDYTVGGCFPVKFLDYLAVGLPTVVTDLPTYVPFDTVCYVSKSYDEFSTNVKKALEEDSDMRVKQRQEVAKVQNWDGKISNMLNLISENMK